MQSRDASVRPAAPDALVARGGDMDALMRELHFVLKAGRFGAWALDLATGELTTSEICRTNFGLDPQAPFTYEQLQAAVHPEDRARMCGAVDHAIASGTDYDIEYRIVTPAGDVRWVLIRAQPSYGPDGSPLKMTGVSIDITDRKRNEARKSALVELNDAIRDNADADGLAYAAAGILGRTLGVSRAGYATVDPDKETLHVERDWNAPGVASLAGTLRLRDYGSFVDSLKRGEFVAISDVREDERTAAASEALESRGARSFVNVPVVEQRRLRAVFFVNHGEARDWSADDLALVKEVAERTRTAVERIRNDEALRDSEERYRTLFENIDAGFCVIEVLFDQDERPVDYRFIEVNPAFAAQTDLTDAVGRTMRGFAPSMEQHWFDFYGNIALTGTPQRIENEAVALGRWYEVDAFRVGAPEQRRVAVLFNDVSERKQAESRIRELNETLEAQVATRSAERDRLWNLSQDMLAQADYSGMMSAVSPAWTQVLGWSETELLSRPYATFMHPEDMPPTLEAIGRMAETRRPARFENRIATRDGGFKPIEWTVAPEPDGVNFIAVGRDLSHAKAREAQLEAAQEALRQSQKMEAIGQLTGGVAHDFNNLLTVIRGSIDLMRRGTLPEERRQRHMQAIADTVTRATRLTHQLLAFARRQTLQPEAIDVGRNMRAVSEMLATLTGSRIEIIPHAPAEPCFVNVDPSQFDTALVNMAVNARDAMAGEGTLTIRVQPTTAMPAMRNHPTVNGEFVEVSLADTGSGIPADQLDRIFEPFFTTKAAGAGTGLGLSQVFGFAKQSGGEVMVESVVGEGTTFTLYLPRIAAPAQVREEIAGDEAVEGGGACVLLVEDNEEVGSFATQALIDLGYVAVWASDASEALAELDRDAGRFDVVFSDVIMPGMNGVDLAQEIRRRHPGLPVVLTSGYSSVLAEGGTHGFEMLHKPYSVEQMSRALAKAAARSRRSREAAPSA